MDLSEDSDSDKANRRSPHTRQRPDRSSRSSPKRDEGRSGRRGGDDDRRRHRDREYGRDRDRDRDDDRRYNNRDRRRSRSRDRKSRSSPRRSRSRSRERSRGSYSKRYDRGPRTDRVERNERGNGNEAKDDGPKDRFFMPGITGRFRDQIERRKLLWQKKSEPDQAPEPKPGPQPLGGPGGSRATKLWETTTFAQDTDGKVASKFKRLMGIRNSGEGSGASTDVLKKQEEMFSSMEAQYEVARTATHTMRGVGLGFGSFQK
ncbi:uncharacterized protein ZC262.2 isoform X2 [Aethina tumida]|nr:uncharacterized protein ZC262.2 isoform X2 [Aethina tumida]